MLYNIRCKIDQIVTKEVELSVVAGSEEEAEALARLVLNDYPQMSIDSRDVKRVVTTKSNYWIPKSIDFIEIKESKKTG